jgi:hypothetical protein
VAQAVKKMSKKKIKSLFIPKNYTTPYIKINPSTRFAPSGQTHSAFLGISTELGRNIKIKIRQGIYTEKE